MSVQLHLEAVHSLLNICRFGITLNELRVVLGRALLCGEGLRTKRMHSLAIIFIVPMKSSLLRKAMFTKS